MLEAPAYFPYGKSVVMRQIFSDSTSGKYQKLYTALEIEEIEGFEWFYTSKTLREIYSENTRLSKKFPSLTGKKQQLSSHC